MIPESDVEDHMIERWGVKFDESED